MQNTGIAYQNIEDSSAETDGEDNTQKTTLVSRNVTVLGRRTSIRLEPEMWKAFKEIATRERCTIHDLCAVVSIRKAPNTSLTAGIRVFIMLYFRSATTEEGHTRVGHGNFDLMKQRARISDNFKAFFSPRKPDHSVNAM